MKYESQKEQLTSVVRIQLMFLLDAVNFLYYLISIKVCSKLFILCIVVYKIIIIIFKRNEIII